MDLPDTAATVATLFAGASTLLVRFMEEGVDQLAGEAADAIRTNVIELWRRIRGNRDRELDSSIELLALKPEDERRVAMVAEIVLERLEADPELLAEVIALLSDSESVQEIRATNRAMIERVHQDISGRGRQSVEADNSAVRDVRQRKF